MCKDDKKWSRGDCVIYFDSGNNIKSGIIEFKDGFEYKIDNARTSFGRIAYYQIICSHSSFTKFFESIENKKTKESK